MRGFWLRVRHRYGRDPIAGFVLTTLALLELLVVAAVLLAMAALPPAQAQVWTNPVAHILLVRTADSAPHDPCAAAPPAAAPTAAALDGESFLYWAVAVHEATLAGMPGASRTDGAPRAPEAVPPGAGSAAGAAWAVSCSR